MKNNLLASVALFGELYKSETYKSISDILADFIKGAVSFENIYSFNSTELKDILRNVYGFNIPESVVRTTLKNKLKDCVTRENNYYHFDKNKCSDHNKTTNEVERINIQQEKIIAALCDYIAKKKSLKISQEFKEKIWNNLSNYLMDNSYLDEHSELISAFLISNDSNKDFIDSLNLVKEGLILYQGICFSEDISKLGSWKEKLTIYLSTEHLFNCIGYNGIIFKEIFDDFIKLINEINHTAKNEHKYNIIQLKYLEETKKEVDNFFQSAESIKNGHKRLDPTKVAMSTILQGCNDIDDIKLKQVNFFIELKRLGILLQEYPFERINDKYNILDNNLIEQLKKSSEEKNKYFDEEYCIQCLRIFTKVNCLRNGVNNVTFEKIRHLYVTENNFAKYIAHNYRVKFNDTDIAFAKDIDYVITKFWFKLKKGFSNQNSLPKTFDVITKAKIIVSSHVSNSLLKSYDKLQKDYKNGKLNEEQAIELNRIYKEKPLIPEQINSQNIEDSIEFLNNESYVEDFFREKTRKETELLSTVKEKEALQNELNFYKQKEKDEQIKKENHEKELKSIEFAKEQWVIHKKNCFSNLRYVISVFFLTILPIGIGLVLKLCKPVNDWLNAIGNFQILIWVILILLLGVELIGRSYIFNKEKVKEGWRFMLIIFKLKLKIYKNNYLRELINKY